MYGNRKYNHPCLFCKINCWNGKVSNISIGRQIQNYWKRTTSIRHNKVSINFSVIYIIQCHQVGSRIGIALMKSNICIDRDGRKCCLLSIPKSIKITRLFLHRLNIKRRKCCRSNIFIISFGYFAKDYAWLGSCI